MGRKKGGSSSSSAKNNIHNNCSSPYAAAAKLLNQILEENKSFKQLVYSKDGKQLQCTKTTYAQVCQVLSYKVILDRLIDDACPSLRDEIRNSGLLLVLLYELLWGPNRTIKGGGAVKRKIVQHERALRRTLEESKELSRQIQELETRHNQQRSFLPRYARVNTLLTSSEEVCKTLLKETKMKGKNEKGDDDKSKFLEFYVDPHVPNVLVFPPSIIAHVMGGGNKNNDKGEEEQQQQPSVLSRQLESLKDMIQSGKLILQDKSSCFSALCLVHGFGKKNQQQRQQQGSFVDACAAPGNKTQHLAALLASTTATTPKRKGKKSSKRTPTTKTIIYAVDRSPERLESLSNRMKQLVPSNHPSGIQVIPKCEDFLKLQPKDFVSKKGGGDDIDDDNNNAVTSILLDPSCSGSGIYTAPDRWTDKMTTNSSSATTTTTDNETEETKRIESLAHFQEKALRHAMTSFPSVSRIVYSTCSLHDRENEMVVMKALSSSSAANNNNNNNATEDKAGSGGTSNTTTSGEDHLSSWRIIAPTCLNHWKRRGHPVEGLSETDTKSMIRATSEDETNGFFVCCLERRVVKEGQEENNEDDEEADDTTNVASHPDVGAVAVTPKGVSLYNGQFSSKKQQTGTNKSKVVHDSPKLSKRKETKQAASGPATPSKTSTKDKKSLSKGESSSSDEVSSSAPPTKARSPASLSKTKAKEGLPKSSDDKLASKKRAKKLAWKKRQMEQKQDRLKQKKPKTSNDEPTT